MEQPFLGGVESVNAAVRRRADAASHPTPHHYSPHHYSPYEGCSSTMTNPANAPAARPSRHPIRTVAVAATAAAALLAGCSTDAPHKPAHRQSTPSPHTSHHDRAKPEAPKPTPTRHPSPVPTPEPAGFSPYVDTSLRPPLDLLKGAEETGVKEYTLAFVSPGGGCVPKWGGRQPLDANPVARQADRLRARGGDVRVSFGGQSGNELARACGSVDALVKAYRTVIDTYGLTKVDFDLEGPALTDTQANELRARALARLQQQRRNLDVSFTLPVLPSGLNRHSVAVLATAKKYGFRLSAVNIMAMDYGTFYDGDMGAYAIAAATATHKQLKTALGIRNDATAWRTVAVTPMIGVNDVKGEVFTTADAAQLKRFADAKGLGRLSMWSLTRDKPCLHGGQAKALATCSSIKKDANAFARIFAGRPTTTGRSAAR
ncbi:chitinase [Streptomyces chattanoogensis]